MRSYIHLVALLALPLFALTEGKVKLCAEFPDFASVLCDGKVDCKDGSDEAPATCHKNFSCSATTRVKCQGSSTRVTCIRPGKICDGTGDCPGGWDESAATCRNVNCTASGRVACPVRKGETVPLTRCISPSQLCNGRIECPTGRDEAKEVCTTTECKDTGRISCPSGIGCLRGDWQICNGKSECADGSDEWASTCSKPRNCSSGAKCPGSNQCLECRTDLCNGKKDCVDGSDETPALCPNVDCEDREQCPGGSTVCLRRKYFCDGIPSGKTVCNGLDEDPKFCATWTCTEDFFRIPGTNRCARGTLCDGTVDSNVTNSKGFPLDEDPAFCTNYTCPNGGFKCANGVECTYPIAPCDGTPQCSDKSDEESKFCKSYKCSTTGRPSCPTGGGCLYSKCNFCDAIKDCPDGSDENPKYCPKRDKECPALR